MAVPELFSRGDVCNLIERGELCARSTPGRSAEILLRPAPSGRSSRRKAAVFYVRSRFWLELNQFSLSINLALVASME